MSIPVPQSNFTVGEITHRMAGAITLDQYGLALTKARNFHILPQGPVRKRSGYNYITETKFQPGSGKETIAWIDFIFNKNQAYAIEAGDKYFRFYTNGGRVLVSGNPYEIVTPYLASQVQDLKFVQISDIMYITHTSHPVYKLKRLGETNWTMAEVKYIDGPYMEVNKTDTIVSWSSTYKPAGSGSPSQAWDSDKTSQSQTGGSSGTATYTFSGSTEIPVNGYAIHFQGGWSDSALSYAPSQSKQMSSWQFQGQKNGSGTWVTLDTRTAEHDWLPGETRVYDFTNLGENAYHAYRINWDSNNGGAETTIYEIYLRVQGISGTFTFNSVTGINNDQGFTANDVGRYVRFQGPDTFWRYFIITSVTNATTVVAKFYGLWFFSTGNTAIWRLGSFSKHSGYPAAVSLFEERLALGGSISQPRTVWLTKTNDFEAFAPDRIQIESGAISVTLTGEYLDAIKWLSPGKGLFAGTAGGVTSISGGNDPLTYKNVRQVSQTNYGASSTRPMRVGPALLFQAAFANCIRELLYNFNDDAYDAPDITYLNEHLYKAQFASVWLESPDEMALTPMQSGIMAALTYVRAQKVYGSTAYETDGSFISVCAIPNVTKKRADNYVVVQRVIQGVTKQYVEYSTEPFEYQEMNASCFLDSSLNYSGSPASTFSGLGHLEGKEVVIAGYSGAEKSPRVFRQTVVSGQVTIAASLNKVNIGLAYTSQIEILRSRSNRPDQATSFGSRIRIDHVLLDLYRTAGLTINTPSFEKKDQVQLRGTGDPMDEGTPLFTGKKIVEIEGSWQDGGVLSIWSEDPYPAMIRVIMPTKDKEP